MSDDEGVLARWSRRKRRHALGVSDGSKATPADGLRASSESPPVPATVPSSEVQPDPTADLPPVESLDADSDYTGFLADGVPEHLARAALRRLWRTDPVLANLDGLNDYDEDFTIVQTLGAALASANDRAGETQASAKDDGESPGDRAAVADDRSSDSEKTDESKNPEKIVDTSAPETEGECEIDKVQEPPDRRAT